MTTKYLFLLLFIFSMSHTIFGQDLEKEVLNETKKDTLTIGVDLMSRYIFRGTNLGGSSPSIQPSLEYSRGKFSIGVWGAYSFNQNANQEVDLYISYAFNEHFSITVTDYFFPTDEGNYKYFDYDELTTGHLLEASISYKGTEKLPITVLVATNFFGADPVRLNADGTRKNIQYSTYAEVGYSFNKLDAFIGFNLTNPDESLGESGFYGDNFGVVNLGISTEKAIKITKTFELPLSFSLITNPQAQKIFLVFGISL